MFQPFGNVTALPPAQWHPSPGFRGTFDILTSCTITMSLCIWTSLHLNLPEHRRENLQSCRKLGWMLMGLLAPEVIVWNAWEQRRQARSITRLMRETGHMPKTRSMWRRSSDVEDANLQEGFNGRRHPWTSVHSWYVVMGGFAFEDVASENQQFMIEGRSRMVVTPQGFGWLIRNAATLVPDISRAQIEDKSKSDGLGKFLTCWQAIYFCAQCIFRLSQGFSLTLLEVNVFAHAICALFMFMIWWDKPRDVLQPDLIRDDVGLDICAWFCLKKQLSLWTFTSCAPSVDRVEIKGPTALPVNKEGHVYSYGSTHMPCIEVQDTFWTMKPCGKAYATEAGRSTCRLDERTINRLRRAYRFDRDQPVDELEDQLARPRDGPQGEEMDGRSEVLLTLSLRQRTGISRRSRNWTLFTFYDSPQELANLFNFSAGFTLFGLCTGGLHLVAWNAILPSNAETVLWRASSITVSALGPAMCAAYIALVILTAIVTVIGLLLFAIGKCMLPKAAKNWIASFRRRIHASEGPRGLLVNLGEVSILLLTFLVILAVCGWYLLCRVFLVVECCIMLAHVPETALRVPTWSAYIPHIS